MHVHYCRIRATSVHRAIAQTCMFIRFRAVNSHTGSHRRRHRNPRNSKHPATRRPPIASNARPRACTSLSCTHANTQPRQSPPVHARDRRAPRLRQKRTQRRGCCSTGRPRCSTSAWRPAPRRCRGRGTLWRSSRCSARSSSSSSPSPPSSPPVRPGACHVEPPPELAKHVYISRVVLYTHTLVLVLYTS